MRIQGVTGDLPAVAQLSNEGVAKAEQPSATSGPPPAVASPPATTDAGNDHASSDRRRPPQPLASFDPPLIAQRAVLGWPVGPLVAAHARAEGISYTAAWAAVDRAMPADAPPA